MTDQDVLRIDTHEGKIMGHLHSRVGIEGGIGAPNNLVVSLVPQPDQQALQDLEAEISNAEPRTILMVLE